MTMRKKVALSLRRSAKVEAKPGKIQALYDAKKKAYKKLRSESQFPKLKQSKRQERLLKNKI